MRECWAHCSSCSLPSSPSPSCPCAASLIWQPPSAVGMAMLVVCLASATCYTQPPLRATEATAPFDRPASTDLKALSVGCRASSRIVLAAAAVAVALAAGYAGSRTLSLPPATSQLLERAREPVLPSGGAAERLEQFASMRKSTHVAANASHARGGKGTHANADQHASQSHHSASHSPSLPRPHRTHNSYHVRPVGPPPFGRNTRSNRK